jgi:hypothetical protein
MVWGCISGLVANDIRLTKRYNALSSRSDVTRDLPDLGKSFTLLVCVCFLTNRLTTAYQSTKLKILLIYTERKKLSTPDIFKHTLSLDSNIYIDYSKNNVPLKRCAHTGLTIMSNID